MKEKVNQSHYFASFVYVCAFALLLCDSIKNVRQLNWFDAFAFAAEKTATNSICY